MKVLHLGKHYPFYGGIEKFYFDLSKELNSEGIESDIFCANETKYNKMFYDNKMKIITYGRFAFKASTSLSYKGLYNLKNILDDYDVLHVHLPDPMIVIFLFFLRPRQYIIVHWHSDIVKQKTLKKFFLVFQNWILNQASKIITTSPNYIYSSKDLQSYKQKCIAIPSGLDPERLYVNADILQKLKDKYRGKTIIYSFGRMTEYKGFRYLIEAMIYFPSDYHLIIAGGGDTNQYKELVNKLNLNKMITFAGKISDKEVGAYYKLCDIFVLSSISRNEAFGLVQCEAMYFGKPIISTDIKGSGVSYVNKEGETGFIVPIKDSKSIYNASMKLMGDNELYELFSVNAKLRFEQMFHINSVAHEIIKIYKEILNDNKK